MPPLWPLVFGNALMRYEANSGPQRNLHNSAEWAWQGKRGLMRQVYIQAAARAEGSSWNKNPVRLSPSNSKSPFRSHPSTGEIKVPRNRIQRSQHTPQETAYSERKKSRRNLKTLQRERLWCREPLHTADPPFPGARCLWILPPPQAPEASSEPLSRCLAARI